jgi:hypothetical protein
MTTTKADTLRLSLGGSPQGPCSLAISLPSSIRRGRGTARAAIMGAQ